jgi:hypothetical protein
MQGEEGTMGVGVGIWRLGSKVERIEFSPLPSEHRLEEVIAADISIIDPQLLLIGRQVRTAHDKVIDLLAMDADGKLVVIELKRAMTPREAVSQLLDYGSWVRALEEEDIAAIFESFLQRYRRDQAGTSLDDAFRQRFNVREMPESLNEGHELFLVATDLDSSSERIVKYLSDEYGVAINVVLFGSFREGNVEYLTRVWLIDPAEAEVKVIERRAEEPWNREYYVSFGESDHRRWSDARRLGYVAAGGGSWYSKTLGLLEPGARIWANVPGRGYVGVGTVTEAVVPITRFTVPDASGKMAPISQVVPNTPDPHKPEDELEHYVRVKWLKTVPLEEAVREKGFFGNQNSAAKPKSKKWVHTVERLKQRWRITD